MYVLINITSYLLFKEFLYPGGTTFPPESLLLLNFILFFIPNINMPRSPCTFFNSPKGCRNGSSCKFLHNADSHVQHSSFPNSQSPTDSSHQRPSNHAPRGVCDFFWKTGTCKREFACRFQHTRSSANNVGPSTSTITSQPSAIDMIAPFLTEEGLARVSGTGTDVFFSADSNQISPTIAHNALKRFLFDDFRFRITSEIYAFLKPLSSAHTGNNSWVSDLEIDWPRMLIHCLFSVVRGRPGIYMTSLTTLYSNSFISFFCLHAAPRWVPRWALLDSFWCILQDNGLLRISDILRWSPVSIMAGSSRDILSFQRGYLPLFRVRWSFLALSHWHWWLSPASIFLQTS